MLFAINPMIHTRRVMPTGRQAFTLVELLVVIAIIGLLSTIAVISMNAARTQARDAKRKADLLQISKAIELYADTNGHLPRNSVGWCTYVTNPPYAGQVQSDLAPYLANFPLDPTKANQSGDYFYYNRDNKDKYILCAQLENATGQSYDYTLSCAGVPVYNYCIMPNGGS
jgi:type II secretion system protein G